MGFLLHSRSPVSFPFCHCIVSSKAPLVPGHNHAHQSRNYCDLLCPSRLRNPSLHSSSAPVHAIRRSFYFPRNWRPSAFSVYIKTSRTPRHVCCALALFSFLPRISRASPSSSLFMLCQSPMTHLFIHVLRLAYASAIELAPRSYLPSSANLLPTFDIRGFSFSFAETAHIILIPFSPVYLLSLFLLSRTPQSCSITSKAHFSIPQVQ